MLYVRSKKCYLSIFQEMKNEYEAGKELYSTAKGHYAFATEFSLILEPIMKEMLLEMFKTHREEYWLRVGEATLHLKDNTKIRIIAAEARSKDARVARWTYF